MCNMLRTRFWHILCSITHGHHVQQLTDFQLTLHLEFMKVQVQFGNMCANYYMEIKHCLHYLPKTDSIMKKVVKIIALWGVSYLTSSVVFKVQFSDRSFSLLRYYLVQWSFHVAHDLEHKWWCILYTKATLQVRLSAEFHFNVPTTTSHTRLVWAIKMNQRYIKVRTMERPVPHSSQWDHPGHPVHYSVTPLFSKREHTRRRVDPS